MTLVAGALREGGLVFALARINKEFEVGKGDRIKSYLMFSSPHRVGEAIRVKTLTLRLVCMNGLFTTNHAVEYSQSHIGMFDFAKARERVNFAHDELAEAEKRYKRIRALKMNIDDAMNKVLAPILAPDLVGKVEIDNLPPKLAQALAASTATLNATLLPRLSRTSDDTARTVRQFGRLAEGLADRDYLAKHTDFSPEVEAHLASRTPAWA